MCVAQCSQWLQHAGGRACEASAECALCPLQREALNELESKPNLTDGLAALYSLQVTSILSTTLHRRDMLDSHPYLNIKANWRYLLCAVCQPAGSNPFPTLIASWELEFAFLRGNSPCYYFSTRCSLRLWRGNTRSHRPLRLSHCGLANYVGIFTARNWWVWKK